MRFIKKAQFDFLRQVLLKYTINLRKSSGGYLMPIYEYMCNKCSMGFSLIKLTIEAQDAVCPQCGSKDVKKKMSTFSSVGYAPDYYSGKGG